MKLMKYMLGLLVVAGVMSCEDEFKFDYDAGAVVPVVQGFAGPSSASANNVTEYEYSTLPRGGSSFAFVVVGANTISITQAPETPYLATIVFAESPVDLSALVTVIETAANGKSSEQDTVAVSVEAYCSYDAQDLVGTLPGLDVRNNDYASQITFASTGSDTMFDGTGFANEWMFDYWGEVILASASVDVELDALGLFLTIPEQYLMTTEWNGDPYDYSIEGSGLVNACTGAITIEYKLINTTDGYDVSGFVATVTFP